MFTKKLFPIARSKKDWQAISKKLDIAFHLMDDLQETSLTYESDEYDFERFETRFSKVINLVDSARTIANCYE